MKIQRVDLEHCGTESDCVVVIDVLRAFTTAAVAFAHGAREIILAGTIEELFDLAALTRMRSRSAK
jgi:2-phosphosulfolactate phosphatase